MKAYKEHLRFLEKLTPDEALKELQTAQEDIKGFIMFLRELEADTSDPEAYRDLLDLVTAYSCYGLELIAERTGVENTIGVRLGTTVNAHQVKMCPNKK